MQTRRAQREACRLRLKGEKGVRLVVWVGRAPSHIGARFFYLPSIFITAACISAWKLACFV